MTNIIIIIIDIGNNPEILQLIRESIPYLPGWEALSNTEPGNYYWDVYPNKTPRYFKFDFTYKQFTWACKDEEGDQLPKDNVTRIKTTAHISKLLNSIYEYIVRHLS